MNYTKNTHFMHKLCIVFLLAILLLSNKLIIKPVYAVTSLTAFVDYKEIKDENKIAATWAVSKGVIQGIKEKGKTYFGVNRNTTRVQFVIMIWRAEGRPKATNVVKFKDVTSGKDTDGYKAIQWAQSKGIIKGYSDGTFRPNKNITRRDIAIMLYRLAGSPKWDVPYYSRPSEIEDNGSNTTITENAVDFCVYMNIMSVYGKINGNTIKRYFYPNSTVTRMNAVQYLYNYETIYKQRGTTVHLIPYVSYPWVMTHLSWDDLDAKISGNGGRYSYAAVTATKKYYRDLFKIVKSIVKDGDSTEKAYKAITKWVMDNVSYDYNQPQSANWWNNYRKGKLMCGGYSALILHMCQMCNIDCMCVSGQSDIAYHGWNRVYLKYSVNGDTSPQWYYSDITRVDQGKGYGKYFLVRKNPHLSIKSEVYFD